MTDPTTASKPSRPVADWIARLALFVAIVSCAAAWFNYDEARRANCQAREAQTVANDARSKVATATTSQADEVAQLRAEFGDLVAKVADIRRQMAKASALGVDRRAATANEAGAIVRRVETLVREALDEHHRTGSLPDLDDLKDALDAPKRELDDRRTSSEYRALGRTAMRDLVNVIDAVKNLRGRIRDDDGGRASEQQVLSAVRAVQATAETLRATLDAIESAAAEQ